MPQKLIKLDDYEIAWKARTHAERFNTNIECPDCQDELLYHNPCIVLTCYPPKEAIYCPSCGFKTHINI